MSTCIIGSTHDEWNLEVHRTDNSLATLEVGKKQERSAPRHAIQICRQLPKKTLFSYLHSGINGFRDFDANVFTRLGTLSKEC